MGTISAFFNHSKFEIMTKNSNGKAVLLDTEYFLPLEIYDVLGLDVPSTITASLATKNGRTVTALPTVVTVTALGLTSFSFSFTIATGDWDGVAELLLDINVVDSEAYVYNLEHVIKV